MRVETILNRVQKQPGFVYGAIRFIQARGAGALEVEVRYRAGGRPTCSGCGQPGPGYDTLPTRQYEFVPLWASPSSSPMPGGAWTAGRVGCGRKPCPGPRASTT